MILQKYSAKPGTNFMRHSGDLINARKEYLERKNLNLIFLLESRFAWMNEFIDTDMIGVELGSGIAASKDYIFAKEFLTTDFYDSKWIDVKNVNALSTPFKDNSKDFVIASNMIHHVAYPTDFFTEVYRILKPGGLLLIQEVHTSVFLRLILSVMRHEGYNENIDVFDKYLVCNDPNDAWSANCSIPKLLFKRNMFEKNFTGWEIKFDKKVEFIIFLNSGGVTAKTFYIPLPLFLLKILRAIDSVIIAALPGIFALQRQIVVQKSFR